MSGLGPCQIVVLLVALQRGLELGWSRRNERWLRAQGGVEVGARHYPLFILLHASWLAALWLWVPADASVNIALLATFVLLQIMRVWVIASLGAFWTTRIITLPAAPLSQRGPYRWVRHPNYLVVAGEIAVLPLAFGAWPIALVFSTLNAALLAYRVRIEDLALAPRRVPAGPSAPPH